MDKKLQSNNEVSDNGIYAEALSLGAVVLAGVGIAAGVRGIGKGISKGAKSVVNKIRGGEEAAAKTIGKKIGDDAKANMAAIKKSRVNTDLTNAMNIHKPVSGGHLSGTPTFNDKGAYLGVTQQKVKNHHILPNGEVGEQLNMLGAVDRKLGEKPVASKIDDYVKNIKESVPAFDHDGSYARAKAEMAAGTDHGEQVMFGGRPNTEYNRNPSSPVKELFQQQKLF